MAWYPRFDTVGLDSLKFSCVEYGLELRTRKGSTLMVVEGRSRRLPPIASEEVLGLTESGVA